MKTTKEYLDEIEMYVECDTITGHLLHRSDVDHLIEYLLNDQLNKVISEVDNLQAEGEYKKVGEIEYKVLDRLYGRIQSLPEANIVMGD